MDQQLGVVFLLRQFYPLTGGYQNQALRLALELMKRRIKVYVVTQRQGSLPSYEVYHDIPIHRVFAFQNGHLAALSYFCFSLLWMFRNRRKFQLIHANRSSSGLIAGLIGFLLRKRALYKLTRGDEIDVKGFRTTLLGYLKVYCLKRSVDKFVAITREIENDLRQLGIPSKKLARIPNGIDMKKLSPPLESERVKCELGWKPDAKVVTFVGRLVRAKGLDWLLVVWRDVLQQEGVGRLLIVGEGPERYTLESAAAALGIKNTVAFIGYQNHVPRFLAATDIFVLPSRLEGISNALLEAMSQGLPVVVADDELGGNREVVDNEVDGFVVEFGNSTALAKILVALLKDPELRSRIGEKAKFKIGQRFSMQSVADGYCRIYSELSGHSTV